MGIHSKAIIDPRATIHDSVDIGPYAVIGPDVLIGEGTRIHSHVVLNGRLTIGHDCEVYPFACIGGAPQDLKYKGEDTRIEMGAKNVVREYVTINPGTKGGGGVTEIGNENMIMAYVHIAHDCRIGSNTVIANCTQLSGHVHIQDGARLSGMVAVHHFVTIGKLAFVSGGSKVGSDVPPFMITDGYRVRKLNDELLKRMNVSKESHQALRKCFKLFYRSENTHIEAMQFVKDENLCQYPEVDFLIKFFETSGGEARMLEKVRQRVSPSERDGDRHQDIKDVIDSKKNH